MTPPTARALGALVTGREQSLFQDDLSDSGPALDEAFSGTRCLVVGGAGSIGRATLRQLLAFEPSYVHVLDIDENGLVELVRDLRAEGAVPPRTEFRTSTVDYGSSILRRHLATTEARYDRVLNFAAVKHVRAERDVPSLLHMLDVNVCRMFDLTQWLGERDCSAYFAVSTDKAADPVNLMGASKRAMEHVVLSHPDLSAASARFANVAFSAGSLLEGWLNRLRLRQPLPVPRDTRRFLVTAEESGQICLLASAVLPRGAVAVPPLMEGDLRLLTDVVGDVLAAHGYEPVLHEDPQEAMARLESDARRGRWPVIVTDRDTVGEKEAEKFATPNDTQLDVPTSTLRALRVPVAQRSEVASTVADLTRLTRGEGPLPRQQDVVEVLRRLVPELVHLNEGQNLDDRQ